MNEAKFNYIAFIREKVSTFANSIDLECETKINDYSEQEGYEPHTYLYVYFKRLLNDVEENQLGEIFPNWKFAKKNITKIRHSDYPYRYLFMHKNILSEVRGQGLKELL